MRLIVWYKSPTEADPQALTTIELPQQIAEDIAINRNTLLEHGFTIELTVSKHLGTDVAPVGGLR